MNVVGLVDTSSVTTGQALGMDIANPVDVSFEVGSADTALESNDVLVGDVLGLAVLLGARGSKGGREQSSEEES